MGIVRSLPGPFKTPFCEAHMPVLEGRSLGGGLKAHAEPKAIIKTAGRA